MILGTLIIFVLHIYARYIYALRLKSVFNDSNNMTYSVKYYEIDFFSVSHTRTCYAEMHTQGKTFKSSSYRYAAGYIRFISLQLLSCDAEIILCKLIQFPIFPSFIIFFFSSFLQFVLIGQTVALKIKVVIKYWLETFCYPRNL